ncbi:MULTISPECIES: phosphate signaling complex protein PhoU [unclassified Tolypothrix]|uniref:phosphate signaling complex protein PhoU n=1 Tax=unclassified Tolypothrix TaxID=2649714 RepID=UPI0005EAC295|nr:MULTISPECIES: phosphate signaling complex protein PhoU [unclassified Tolypothrix]BAY94099.1 phosphate regulon transcriptional regulator [Microchaete diplosiphon NIES-3275]EKF03697.1 phosphate regulon [Tolypothrix sp. PCC 7601]MBE9085418.1 phosphate signaling complex protein PhoU [Tolypothrix sp. LEGE 11397]UYD27860.1 phosphate signaling complex protein PhoU [Tolypothrix sp. PCC 7712]UYD36274.1 phosphate signaling complex protein PhoU [Tolypothrix sp. PCC 7601]
MKAIVYPPNPDPTQLARAIRRLERDVLRMGALVEQSFRLSHQALFARNLTAAEELPQLDKKIDRFYRQIESDCTAIMTLQAPTAQDLRHLSAFMQLVRDLERIGDYAEDLADIAIKLFPYPPHPSIPEIAVMSHHAQAMLATSLVALADLDEAGGRSIQHLDDAVDHAYERLYNTLAFQKDVPGVVEPIVLLALAIRCLERMADHATNIGQRVAYIVTGQRY